MKKTSEFKKSGILYLISTPIGNLKDISERALETLKSLDILFCEDTRVTSKLLSHFSINLPLDSYHDFSKLEKEDKILSLLESGKVVGLVSDAGSPIISDPGYELVKRAVESNFKVYHIPGSSAGLSALCLSSLPPRPYLFYGFLDKQDSKKIEELEKLESYPFTIIFYESPLRIKKTLKDIYSVFGERKASISRELTKMYEETIYLNLSEYESLEDDIKGEMVLVVEGKTTSNDDKTKIYTKAMDKLLKDGYSINEASKIVASLYSLKRKEIYDEYMRRQK